MSDLDPQLSDSVAAASEAGLPQEGAMQDETARLEAERAAVELAEKQAAEEEAAAARALRLRRLMQRVAAHADFASMKASIQGIQKVARSEKSHVRALTDEIADDIAMTGKLLRLVNAAYYSSVGGGQITSMKRAVDLMGFQTIGMLASSLVLFERLPKQADGDRLRQEFGRAQLAAMLAHEMCNNHKHIDGAYMTALFQNLGSMLGGMHFSEELQEIEADLQASGLVEGHPERGEARERLARQIWGIGIEEIGVEVAAQWGWPDGLRQAMRSLKPSDPERAAGSEEYLRVLCTAANQLAGDMLRLPLGGDEEERAAALKACVDRFSASMAVALRLDPESLLGMVERTKGVWDDLAQTLGFGPVRSTPAKGQTASKPGEAQSTQSGVAKSAAKPSAAPAVPPAASSSGSQVRSATPSAIRFAGGIPAMAEALSSALEKASELALSGAPRGQLLQLCMQTMYDALQLQRVILCLRVPETGALRGKMGLGERANELAPVFQVPMQPPSDLFGMLCAKSADTLITDSADPVIAKRLPGWYAQMQAQTFVLLPMVAGGQVLGSFYGDHAQAGRLVVGEREMRLLKTLRNQVVISMQSGSVGAAR